MSGNNAQLPSNMGGWIATNQNVVLQLAGENLFDTTGRRHSSFSKEFLPLPGRNIRASVRLNF